MRTLFDRRKLLAVSAVAALLVAGGCSTMMGGSGAKLSGAQEVPINASTASGHSKLQVADDKSVSGSVTYSGMTATAAHIHEGAIGSNGPVIIPLTKSSEGTFAAPAGAKLNDAQYAAYKAGNLYVNLHSAAFPGGEIRAQLKPK